ncbi:MAG: geranylgeranylglyceryl/heptaprenylglyceryl phosphate synthase [Candidatus Aenigmatarchaeota archaeon]
MTGKVWNMIKEKIAQGEKLHFSLIDPDPKKVDLVEFAGRVRRMESWGCDAVMIGGSTVDNQEFLNAVVKCVKENSTMPTILFPGGMSGISRYADSIYFMSLVNSRDSMWITGIQSKAAPILAKLRIETLPMAYVIVEPGMKAGEVGKADLIKHGENERAVGYAMSAEMSGMRLVYLEGGSGAHTPVPNEMITSVRSALTIPLIVGGGIRNPETALEKLKAGADIIVTGTIIEGDFDKLEGIVKAVKEFGK